MNKSGAVRAFHFQSHHPIGDSLSPVYAVWCASFPDAWMTALLGTHLEVPVNK